VRFSVLDDVAFIARLTHYNPGQGPIAIPIWTTTPWTLPANQAVAVHRQQTYVVLQCHTAQGAEQLVVIEALVKEVMARYDCEQYKIIGHCHGSALEGLQLQHPFYQRHVPIVLGDHVTVDSGTGAVHTAPGHGPEDFALGEKYHLPLDNPVDGKGCFVENTPLFSGEHISKADRHIIDVLKANGKLLHAVMVSHSYPHCWRHKTPVIYRATPQWFVRMDQNQLREHTLTEIANVQWIPEWGQARITGMIAQRPDWCISRQRYWGVPIALFVHKQTQALHPDMPALMEQVAKRVEQAGVEAWFDLDPAELLGDEAKHYEKVTDILDVWFESGVTHRCVLMQNPRLAFPADLYLEGSDQHRGWFHSSLLSSVAINQKAPYKSVLTHGFAVDAEGRKMSKSLGNVVAPDKIVKTLGADILRLWVASTDYRAEMTVSDEILKRMTDVYRRIRNTARFLLSNCHDFDPTQHHLAPSAMLAIDRWAVDRARALQEDLLSLYDAYQFHAVCQKIHHFCSVDLGSFYLDIIKDRQYTMAKDSVGRRSAQTAMYHILEALVRWLSPILSFTAEEIWQQMPGERAGSVFLATWYDKLFSLQPNEKLNPAFWEQLICVRNAVNKEIENQRNQGTFGSSLEADVTLYCNDQLATALNQLGDELRFVLITSSARIDQTGIKPDNAVATDISHCALTVTKSPHAKCARCWHRCEEIGEDQVHATLCARCITNIAGSGEKRHYV